MSKVINPPSSPVRLSYPALFEPKVDKKGNNKKYSAVLLIPKSDTKLVKMYEDAIALAIEEGIQNCKGWKGRKPAVLKTPLKDGDTPKASGEDRGAEYKDHYYLNVTAGEKFPPGIVDRDLTPLVRVNGAGERVSCNGGETKIFAGCYLSAAVNFSAYEYDGTFGVGSYLNNVMFLKEGERLAGSASAQSDFADFADFGPDAI